MGVRPLHEKVLVKRIDAPETTAGGIIIPDTATDKPLEGIIVAVGDGVILPDGTVKALEVKKGDNVLFAMYAGNEITLEGEEHIILNEKDILAIILP
jgi:chaperonin GroES